MYVIDEITKKKISYENSIKIDVKYLEGYRILGFVKKDTPLIKIIIYEKGTRFAIFSSYELMKNDIVFSKLHGEYIHKYGINENELFKETHVLGNGDFPYSFARKYEAIESFKLFNNKQKIINLKNFTYSKYLKYTFGLEFETSQGYIPENICFRDGLIPLRDGSISGLEYSTVVLKENEGVNLLIQQLNSLKEYTYFNSDCSLHLHFGGFPLDPDKIFKLYILCYNLEGELSYLLPEYAFTSSYYKSTGKDYCKPLFSTCDFDTLYCKLVGRRFFGDFTQPHPYDIERNAKWRVSTRYYWVNFINLLCYNVNKTIEFRVLSPTFNVNKILLWIFIFNAILLYAESNNKVDKIKLNYIINKVYPPELAKIINNGILRLKCLKDNQSLNKDTCGKNLIIENTIFSDFNELTNESTNK